MQQLSYISTDYIYNIYFKFASLLNDDTIYSNVTRLDKTCVSASCSLFGRPAVCNIVIFLIYHYIDIANEWE